MSAKPEVGESPFPVEEIPDDDFLYMRIHKNHIQQDELIPGAIRNHITGMSTDWSKYSTPSETKNRVVTYNKDPQNYGVVSMKVLDVRNIELQSIQHAP